jgi:pantoate--beta-alanine ligase
VLNKSLTLAKELLKKGERNANKLKEIIKEEINKEPLAKIDYVEIVDSDSLENVHDIEKNVLIPIAVYIGKTRLIDNFTMHL